MLFALAAMISALGFLFLASQWWEKAFATVESTEVSPGGCYRLVAHKPFWIIPASFHPDRFPEERWNPFKDWSSPWMPNRMPGFFRLFDSRTGEELGETAVYDLSELETHHLHWPDAELRWMSAGYLRLADDLPQCAP